MHTIVKATKDCTALYNGLIARSKGVWKYSNDYLTAALPLLRITPEYLARSSSHEIRHDGELVGFCAVIDGEFCPLLDHLWIEPHHIGNGAGRFAISWLIETATADRVVAIDAWPDPLAEGFYARIGFEATGDMAPSRVAGGPVFQRFRMNLSWAAS